MFDNPDGELMPTLEVRKQVIRAIRDWKADIVIGPPARTTITPITVTRAC